MALSSFVYISNIDNLSDARYAAGMGVDLVGFKLDPNNPASLNESQFHEISEWIAGVKIVGEFGAAEPAAIKGHIEKYNVDYLLISDESQLHEYTLLGLPLIYRVQLDEIEEEDLTATFNYCQGSVDYFLLEADHLGLSESLTEMVNRIGSKFPLILGFGIDAENAATLTSELNIKGICLKGSPEERPGYKDFDELADVLEALEVD